jgi:orotate phosphoribosyltransferase
MAQYCARLRNYSATTALLQRYYTEGRNVSANDRAELLELLAKYAYDFKPGAFTLASGRVSDEYLDCKMALSRPEAQAALGDLVVSHVDVRAVAVGGLTMGSDPIAINTSRSSASRARPLTWFSVRKDAKGHGTKKMVEGAVSDGDNVVIVDDVATTGGSTIDAIKKSRVQGLNVIQVIVLVDREEGGMQSIRDVAGHEVDVRAIFTKSEIRQAWESRRRR